MATRTITGPLRKPGSDAPWAHTAITFRLQRAFVTGAATIAPDPVAVTTDADGAFSVALAVPDAGAAAL